MASMVETFQEFPALVRAGVFFFIGACIGSFVNVLIYRIPRGLEWARTRSACPSCGHVLGALDLMPIASWLCLRGRCRYCHARVSARYAIVETIFGVAFALIGLYLT